jgi:hypothetical protein
LDGWECASPDDVRPVPRTNTFLVDAGLLIVDGAKELAAPSADLAFTES